MSTNIENLPEAEHEKWHRFIDAVNAAVDEVFEEGDHPALVVGAQWAGMGRDDRPDLPICVVTSNLPVCVTPECIADMLSFAEEAHDEYHGMPVTDGEEDGRVVKVEMDPALVPEDIRQKAIEWAESLGYTAEHVRFIEVADTSDLADLPLFEADPTEAVENDEG